MLFREHRGGLGPSMMTVAEVHSKKDIARLMVTRYPDYRDKIFTLEVKPYSGADDRIGWDETYIVVMHFLDRSGDKIVIGFTNGPV